MTQWVSQSDAVKLLKELGDSISQPALSQYLKGHAEIPRRDLGPGRAQQIDFTALRQSRQTRQSRGPAVGTGAPAPASAELPLSPAPPTSSVTGAQPGPVVDLGNRKAQAEVSRAESDARRARVLADEAEGTVIPRETAVAAFMAAGLALKRAFQERRRLAVEDIRAARDAREADLAIRKYEHAVQAAFSSALVDIAAAATVETAAAQ